MEQDFRKEEEMFRFLYVEGNAYSKHQLASLLGMKDHHFDKFYRRFKKEFTEHYPDYLISTKRKKEVFHRIKYDAYQYDKNILISMYRKNKLQKPAEIYRLAQIIRTLGDEPQSLSELVSFLEEGEEIKKTSYQRSLDYLMGLQVIKKTGSKYSLDHEILTNLTDDELIDLFYFVHFQSNTHVLSVPGYLLLDFLTLYFSQKQPDKQLEFIWYRFINFSKVLAEYKCYELLSAIQNRALITFSYYGKKQKQRAATRTEIENAPAKIKLIPLYLVFDHQYGRWYLIGKNPLYDLSIYKLEGISNIEQMATVTEQEFESGRVSVQKRLEHSWLMSDEPEEEVVLRFYFDKNRTDSKINFIKERVIREGQWGTITEATEDSFLYTINVNGISEIKPWILGFGSSVEVIRPERLRQEIINEWSLILKEHDSDV